MDRSIVGVGLFLGLTGIILGAFGAHALKEILSAEQLISFETGVRYQMYHALFLVFVGSTGMLSDKSKKTVFYLVFLGVLFFSGSIYALVADPSDSVKKMIGPITPIGGTLLIVGWFVTLLHIFRRKS